MKVGDEISQQEAAELVSMCCRYYDVDFIPARRRLNRLTTALFQRSLDLITAEEADSIREHIMRRDLSFDAAELSDGFDEPSERMVDVVKKASVNGNGHADGGAAVEDLHAKRASRNGAAVAEPTKLSREQVLLSPDRITRSPFNPRRHFDKEDLKKLAASLSRAQVQPCVVRPHPSKKNMYELIAGERRWRAAEIARIELRCEVVHVSDEDAIELCVLENREREDLSAIEDALSFKTLLEGTKHNTQEKLAERLGISQGTIAKRLSLLKLPESWQQRIIRREIPASHAQELATWTGYPGVLAQLEKNLDKRGATRPAEATVREFARQITSVARDLSRPLRYGDYYWNGQRSRYVSFKPTADQLKELAPVKIDGDDRTFNIALWDQLQAEGEKKQAEREARRGDTADAAATSPAAMRERAKQKAEQHENRLRRWLCAWRQQRIVAELPKASRPLLEKLLLFFRARGRQQFDHEVAVRKAIEKAGGKIRTSNYSWDEWAGIDSVSDDRIGEVIVHSLEAWFSCDQERCNYEFNQDHIAVFATRLGVSLSKHWHLTEDFLQLHQKDQLLELAREWRFAESLVNNSLKRGEIIAALMTEGPHVRRVPKALLALEKKGGE